MSEPVTSASVAAPDIAPVEVQRPRVIKTGYTLSVVLTDLASRYAAFALWRRGGMSTWIFWVLQLVLIPGLILVWVGRREDRLKAALGVTGKGEYEPAATPFLIAVYIFFAVHNSTYAWLLVNVPVPWLRVVLRILLTGVVFIYSLGLVQTSSTDEIAGQSTLEREAFDTVDENDRTLTMLKAKVETLARKVESYTVEGTFLGAIAFTGFVTIVTTEKGDMEVGHQVFAALMSSLHGGPGVLFHWLVRPWQQVPDEPMIMAVVALTALVCSMLFMAVIAARIRFNSLMGTAKFCTEMASSFNEKEEELDRVLKLGEAGAADEVQRGVIAQRLAQLREYINQYTQEAATAVEQIGPTVAFMTLGRTLALASFLLTLIVGALWFSPVLSVVFIGISLLTYTYPWVDRVMRDDRIRRLDVFRLTRRY